MWKWRVASGAGRFSGKLVICFSTICTYLEVLLSSWCLSVSDPWLWQGSGCGMTNLISKEMWWCWLWGHSVCEVSTGDFQTRGRRQYRIVCLAGHESLVQTLRTWLTSLVPWVMPSIHENYIYKVLSITSFYKNFFGGFFLLKKKVKCFYFSYFGISLFDFVSGVHSFPIFWVSVSCVQMFQLNEMIFESPG